MKFKFDPDIFAVVSGFTIGPYLIISSFLTLIPWNTTWLGILLLIGGFTVLYNKNTISKNLYKIILVPLALIGAFSLIYSLINLKGDLRFIILIFLLIILILAYAVLKFFVNRREINKFIKGFELGENLKYQESLDYFNNALEYYPNHPIVWAGKSMSLLSMNKFEEAYECSKKSMHIKLGFSKFLVKDSLKLMPFMVHGAVLTYSKDYEEALKYFDKCIDIMSNNMAWSNKGYVLSELGRFEEAMKCHDKSLGMDSKFAFAWSSKANTLRKLCKFEEAKKCVDKSLELDSNVPFTWLTKGKIFMDIGMFNEARIYVEKALELDPFYKDAREAREELLDKE